MFPIIIFDKAFHKEILEHNEKMVQAGTILRDDKNLFLITDSIKEVVDHIKDKSITAFGLQYAKSKRYPGTLEKRMKKISDYIPRINL